MSTWSDEKTSFSLLLLLLLVFLFLCCCCFIWRSIHHSWANQPVSQQASDSSCYFNSWLPFSVHFEYVLLSTSSFSFAFFVSSGFCVCCFLFWCLHASWCRFFRVSVSVFLSRANGRLTIHNPSQLQHVDISLECFRSLSFHNIIISYRYCY